MPDFTLEASLGGRAEKIVVGIDEAGRGPWAGPVVAAAVWLRPEVLEHSNIQGLDDSKALSAAARERLFDALMSSAFVEVGVGRAVVAEIDQRNILQASLLAMQRAVSDLGTRPNAALVDGTQAPALGCPVTTVVGGDGRCLSIAAASIAAKVTRDQLMSRLAQLHPGYSWESNAGYGTAAHRAALAKLGVTPHHRRSFQPIREALEATPRVNHNPLRLKDS